MTRSPGADGGPSAILLCDPSTMLAEVVRRTVTDAGFGIRSEATRWIDVIEQTARLGPDVVVVDLALAGHVGLQLTATLQAVAPACPVIVVLPLGVVDAIPEQEGVVAVVDPTDLRPLGRALRRIAQADRQPG